MRHRLIETSDELFIGETSNKHLSDRRHLLPSAALLRTQRATFTALGSSLH